MDYEFYKEFEELKQRVDELEAEVYERDDDDYSDDESKSEGKDKLKTKSEVL